MKQDQIRKVIDVIYDEVFNQGQADLYPGLVSGHYTQHNPLVPDGVAGVMGFLKQVGRLRCEVKRIAIDGDLAFIRVIGDQIGVKRPGHRKGSLGEQSRRAKVLTQWPLMYSW